MSQIDDPSLTQLNDVQDADVVLGYRPTDPAPANRWTFATIKAWVLSLFGTAAQANLSNATPAAPGAAAPGTSSDVSRSDHVHAPPSAGQIGAATTDQLTAEVTRAQAAEAENAAAISTETTRATNAEQANTSAIGAEAATRATADTTLAGAITAETARAQSAESALDTAKADKANTLSGYGITDAATAAALSAEVTRAQAAEAANATAITTETTRATAAETQIANTRQPRQGVLISAGSAATFAISAPGVGDFSVACTVTFSAAGGNDFIIGPGGAFSLIQSGLSQYDGKFFVCAYGGPVVTGSNTTIPIGVPVRVAYVRAAGVGTFYFNGVVDGGGPDATNYTAPTEIVGGGTGSRTVYDFEFYDYALSASQVLALAQGGTVDPADIGGGLGSFAYGSATGSAIAYGTADGNSVDGWGGSGPVAGITAVAGARTGGAGAYFMRLTANGDSPINLYKYTALPAGRRVLITGWVRVAVPDVVTVGFSNSQFGQAGNLPASYAQIVSPAAAANTWTQFSVMVVSAGGIIDFQLDGEGGAQLLDVDDLQVTVVGALVAPDPDERGIGYQWHDVSGNGSDLTLAASGVSWLKSVTAGPQVARGTLTWAGTADAKSLLGQPCFPPNAANMPRVAFITATAGTTINIGTTNNPSLYGEGVVLSPGRNLVPLAVSGPPSSAAADCDLIIEPSSSFTGSLTLTFPYDLAN